MALHTLHDGSKVKLVSARDLIAIEIWNGNRIIDTEHVKRIKGSLADVKAIDSGFHIITRTVQDAGGNPVKESKIIDGQHRHKVLTDYFHENFCAEDFQVLVREKEVASESEVITYFKQLNTQLPIAWKSDPTMVANEYIKALCIQFTGKKERLIREGATKRPYLSVEKVREKFLEIFKAGTASESPEQIKAFVVRVIQYNANEVVQSEFKLLGQTKDREIIEKAASKKFMLAVDPKLAWIAECL